MVFPSVVWCIRWSTLIVSLCTSLLVCESKLTTIKCPDYQLGPRTRWLTVQDIVLLWTSPDKRRWWFLHREVLLQCISLVQLLAIQEADLLELYRQLRWYGRWKGGYRVGGDLPSFALLSSPSRKWFISLSYLIRTSVLSGLISMYKGVQDVLMIWVIDDGLCWMITSHAIIPRNQFRDVFQLSLYFK